MTFRLILFSITTSHFRGEIRRSDVPRAFEREGFVHCSHAHQVLATANRIFRGQTNLVLLEIDPRKLACRVVEENLEGGAELFPHIYGFVPMTAVEKVHPFPCDASGSFAANSEVRD